MLAITISDVKSFMSHLLSKDTFDSFYMVECSIRMGITYQLDGHLNKDFYDSDTKEQLKRSLCLWKEVRSRVFDIIKGKRLPLSMKLVLQLPDPLVTYLLAQSQTGFRQEDIEGVYLNILYHPQSLSITTGISYRIFSLDKSFEHALDDYMEGFLSSRGIG